MIWFVIIIYIGNNSMFWGYTTEGPCIVRLCLEIRRHNWRPSNNPRSINKLITQYVNKNLKRNWLKNKQKRPHINSCCFELQVPEDLWKKRKGWLWHILSLYFQIWTKSATHLHWIKKKKCHDGCIHWCA